MESSETLKESKHDTNKKKGKNTELEVQIKRKEVKREVFYDHFGR